MQPKRTLTACIDVISSSTIEGEMITCWWNQLLTCCGIASPPQRIYWYSLWCINIYLIRVWDRYSGHVSGLVYGYPTVCYQRLALLPLLLNHDSAFPSARILFLQAARNCFGCWESVLKSIVKHFVITFYGLSRLKIKMASAWPSYCKCM